MVWLEISDHAALWFFFLRLLDAHHKHLPAWTVYRDVDEVLSRFSLTLVNLQIVPPDDRAVVTASEKASREYAAEMRDPQQRVEEERLYQPLPLNDDQQSALDSSFCHHPKVCGQTSLP